EMADQLALSLVESRLVTRQIVLTVGYDIENLTDETRSKAYCGEVKVDRYGRKIPKHAHGTANLPRYTSSSAQLMDAVTELFERIADKNLLVRRLNLTAGNVLT
ncbi:DNA methylase, partial [Ruthenibacterium lactatiformans]|nr:DNA methylase [Ruthenibacterium lactatiformans]